MGGERPRLDSTTADTISGHCVAISMAILCGFVRFVTATIDALCFFVLFCDFVSFSAVSLGDFKRLCTVCLVRIWMVS